MKKGVIKASLIGFFLLSIFGVILFSLFSSAYSGEKTYTVGEGISIPLGQEVDYTLRVVSPTEEFVTKGNDNSIDYTPKEAGTYEFYVSYNGTSEKYSFNVTNEKEEISANDEQNISVSSIENYSSPELLDEGYKIKGQVEIDKPVKWESQDNSSGEERFTPAPQIREESKGELEKEVAVYSEENISYEDVLAHTEIKEVVKVGEEDKIKIYWEENDSYVNFEAKDKDNDNYIDEVQWVVPDLDKEQTFSIIIVSKAEHLSSDRTFISDIYEKVKSLDDIWSETINSDEYIRITFEKNLTSKNDITLFPKITSGSPSIDVYEKDKTELIAKFENIRSNQYNKIFLTNLKGEQDTFDLRVIGGSLEFDHIIDPAQSIYNMNPSYKAYWGQPTASNRWQAGTNATQVQYDNMNSENGIYATNIMAAGTSNDYPFWRFNFTLNENSDKIASLYIKFTGYDNATEVGTIYIYNVNSTWMRIGVTPAANGNVTQNITHNIGSYVNSTNHQVMIAIEGAAYDAGDALIVDQIQLIVQPLDVMAPAFTAVPSNASLFYGNQSLLVKFVATDETGFGYYKINDTRFSINQTGFLSNVSPMAVGNYEINVSINDTSNNINWTQYDIQINKSLERCQVLFNDTSPLSYPKTFLVWANCTSSFVLSRNGTNISNNSQQSLPVSTYNFSMLRTDSTNYTFYYNESQMKVVDVTFPLIDFGIGTADNNTKFARTWIYVNTSVIESNEANITFNLYYSNYTKVNSSTYTDSRRTINWTSLSEGTYYYNVTVFDISGYSNSTLLRKIVLNLTLPSITYGLGTEDPGITRSRNWVYVNTSVSNINAEINITFGLYNSSSLINSSTYTDSRRTINWTSLPQGTYYYNVTLFDNPDGKVSTSTRTIILDRSAPNVTILSPNNITYIKEEFPITFNVSLSKSGNVNYTLDEGLHNISMDTTNNKNFYKTLPTLDKGVYTFRVYASDNLGNINNTEKVVFSVSQENVTVNGTILNGNGDLVNSTLSIYDEISNTTIFNQTGENLNANLALNSIYSVEVIPIDIPSIDKITFENINFSEINDTTVKILNLDEVSNVGNFSKVFVIEPQIENFENGTTEFTATSNSLFKCPGWNFTSRSCNGNWVLFMDNLVIGQNYSFTFGPGDPGYAIINITNAIHLDANHSFISNISNQVKLLDNIWSEIIPVNHYVRVTFEHSLTSSNDITIYARNVSGNPRINVYEIDNTSNILAQFSSITNENYYKIYLTNLTGIQDTFDLNVIGGNVEFDYIVDPPLYIWSKNLSINATLPDIGSNSTPAVFYKDSSWYMLSGSLLGTFYGYAWNGTSFAKNLTINSTLPDIGANSHPAVFYKDSTWYMISGSTTGTFYGYAWNGTSFAKNLTINSTLPDIGSNSAPSVFYKDSTWYMISGSLAGTFYGYAWNGTSFAKNLTINASLPKLSALSSPDVFQQNGAWYMLAGESSGNFKGFKYNGTNWLPDATVNTSLPDIGTNVNPDIFYKDSSWYLLSGENLGTFYGYDADIETTPPTYSSVSINNTGAGIITLFSIFVADNLGLSPDGLYIFSTNNTGSWINDSGINFLSTPSWANVTKILNSTAGKMIGYRWYFNDTSGNTNSTPIYVLTTIDKIPPTFATVPLNASLFYGNQSLLVKFTATDETGFGYYKINDTRFSINQTGFLSNVSPMAVGNYEINVSINDTSNNINWTQYDIQINKSNYFNCGVYFNASTPINYPDAFIAYTNCTSAYTLYKNGTSINNASVINSGAGYYNLTVQRTDTSNYTNIFDAEFFTVNEDPENCQVLYNASSPINYPNTFIAYANCTTPFTLTRNGTVIANNSVINSGAGAYNISFSRTDNQNYSITFNQSQFIVSKSTDNCGIDFNASTPVVYPDNFIAYTNCSSDYNFYINGTSILNASIINSGASYYNFTVRRTDFSNYSSLSDTEFFTVLKNPEKCQVLFNETSPLDYPNTFLVWANCTSPFTLMRNWTVAGTVIENNSEQVLKGGTYNFSMLRNDSSNYSIYYNETTFRIREYRSRIINPTTSSPSTAFSGENITIYFNFTDGDSNITSGVNLDSVFIGGINASIQDTIIPLNIWSKDLEINASLPDIGSNSTPTVFYKDSNWYLITGNLVGNFNGFVYNGTNWRVNTTINASLIDIGANSNPAVFYKDSSWYLISGSTTGLFFGYTYNQSSLSWVKNLTINSTLPDIGSNSAPSVFYKDSTWYMISGSLAGTFYGYAWNGTSFAKNLTINASLPDIGALSTPYVFQKDGDWYMIAGESSGNFKGFIWTGASWAPNSTINASLPDLGVNTHPSVFYKDPDWYLITGENLGRFFSYNYSATTSTPQFDYINNVGWQVNVTVPGLNGLQDLFLNATYASITRGDTQINAIDYGDAIPPVALYGANPVDFYNTSSQSLTFDFKCSDDRAISSIMLYGNWTGLWAANYTNSSYSNNTWLNITVNGIPSGYYKWAVWCNDTSNNKVWTNTNRTFKVDSLPPFINVISPPNNSKPGDINLDINYAAIDSISGISSCWYSNDTYSINTTLSNCVNITNVIWGEGNHNVTIWANDTLNNVNSSTITFDIRLPPSVIVDYPFGQTFDQYSSVTIAINATDLNGISTAIAQVDQPVSASENITLHNYSGADNFNSNTIGNIWTIENSSVGANQNCIANINGITPGQAFTSISGGGNSNTSAYCSLVSIEPLYKDFDINISFNITSEAGGDYAMFFKLAEVSSSLNASKQMFFSIGNWTTGYGRIFAIFINDFNISGGVAGGPSSENYGKFRLKRQGNNFTFYSWNNSGGNWIQDYFGENLSFSSSLYPIIETMTTIPQGGNISVAWDNLEVQKDNFFVGVYKDSDEDIGLHNVTFFVNNTLGVSNNTQRTNFIVANVNDPPTVPFILYPSQGSILHNTATITWSNVTDPDGDSLRFNITLLNPNLSFNSTIVSNYGSALTNSYVWDTTGHPDGNYSIKVTVYENATPEKYSSYYILPGNFSLEYNFPPSVIIIYPLGQTFNSKNMWISTNISGSKSIDLARAEITYPNSTKVNITLSNNTQVTSDNFNINSMGSNWWKENSNNGPSQTCVVNIDSTVPGKAFTSLIGDGSPQTDTFCSAVSNRILDGDFDINISWDILASQSNKDWSANFQLSEINSSANATRIIYMDISGWTGQSRGYEIFADDGNFSDYILTRASPDTTGKFRINRTGNIFTFYTWNGTGWHNETVSKSNFAMSRQLYVVFESENAAPKWSYINVSWDNFSVQSNNYRLGQLSNLTNNGRYNVTIFANDTEGSINNTQKTFFVMNQTNTRPSTPYITTPSSDLALNGLYNISWSNVVDSEGDSLKFNITLLNPNLTFNSTIVSNYGDASTNYYQWNTAQNIDGNYSLKVTVYEDLTPQHYNNSNIMVGNFSLNNLPPAIVVDFPIGGNFDLREPITLAINATDVNGIGDAIAQIDHASLGSENITLYSISSSDDFHFNTLGTVWRIENSSIGDNQNCIADIDTSFPGQAFTSIAGDGTPNTDTFCGLVSTSSVYKDFDMNISFNITSETGEDYAILFELTQSQDSLNAGKVMFLSIGNWAGYGRTYDVFIKDGNVSSYFAGEATNDTHGKFRIKRQGNNFTFYSWNNSAGNWRVEYFAENLDFEPSLFTTVESETALPGWGNINVTWDNFTVSKGSFYTAVFSDAEEDLGLHNVTFFVTDKIGNLNSTQKTNFTLQRINHPPTTPFILFPPPGAILNGTQNITWSNVYDPDGDSLLFNITLLNPDLSFNSTLATDYGESSATVFYGNTSNYPDGNYSLIVTVFEADTPEGYSSSSTSGNFSFDNTPPLINFIVPTPGDGSLVTGTVVINVSSIDEHPNYISIANATSEVSFCSTSSSCSYSWNTAGYASGNYTFYITSKDILGQETIKNITFFIDSNPPYFTTIPSNSSLFYGNESLLVQFVATDDVNFGYYKINDTRFSINQTGFLSNASPMAVGNYEINVSINDTSNNINWTRYKVQVNKSQYNCGVYFDVESPITYPNTFIVYTDCASPYTIYKNGTSISNASTINAGAGYYNLTVRRTDSSNYTIFSDTEFFTVLKNPEKCQVLFNETSPLDSPKTFTVWANCTTPFTLMRNGTTIVNNSEQALAISAYNFSMLRTDSANYTFYYNQSAFRVIDAGGPYFTTIPDNSSLFYGNESLLVQFVGTDDTGFGYYRVNDTRFSINQTGFLSNVSSLAVGNYEINVSINDTSNNLNWTRYKVQVNKSQDSCGVYFNTSTLITYPDLFIVYTNCTSPYTLTRNGTAILNASTINSGAGYYNLTVRRTDSSNYTNIFNMEFFTVNRNPEQFNVLFNASTLLVYPDVFLVYANSTSAFTLYRNGTSIPNNSVQNNGAGYFNFSARRTDNSNYTYNYNDSLFTVLKNPENCQVLYNASSPINYPDTFIAYANCTTPFTLTRNGTVIANNSVINSGAGAYNISFSRTDNQNYSITFNQSQFIVNKATDNCSVYFNKASPIVYPDNFIAYTNCSSDYTLYRNGTSISNASTINSGASYYNFTVRRTDSSNYTILLDTEFFTVLKNPEKCQVLFNETSPLDYPKTFLVWANCTSPFTLMRNGTTIVNNSEQALAISAYNFSMLRTDNLNYTFYYNESAFRIIDTTFPLIDYTLPTEGNNTNFSRNWIYVNTSVVEANFANITFNLYYSNYTIRNSSTYNDSRREINFTSLASGSYYYNVTAIDMSNNMNYTLTRKITLDTIPPTVNLLFPSNGIATSNPTVWFSSNFSENYNLANATFYLWNSTDNLVNRTTINITGISNFTNLSVILPYNNNFKWNYFACDNLSNCAWNSTNYSLAYESPSVGLSVLYPPGNIGVARNQFFNVTLNVTCLAGECGTVNVSLDPLSWWDSSWLYRKEINLSGTGAALSDFQVPLTINLTNEYNQRKINSTCKDIRFTNSSGSVINYWIDTCNITGGNSKFWVRVPSIASSGNTTIYMYYGNSAVESTSNGTSTFDFYDNFSGDLSKWTTEIASGVYPRIESGYLVSGGGSTTSPYGHTSIGSSPTYNNFSNGTIEGKIYLTTDSISEIAFRGNYGGNTGYKSRADARSGQGLSFLNPPYSGWNFLTGCTVTGVAPAIGSWLDFNLTADGNTFTIVVGGQTKTCTSALYSSPGEIAFQNHYGSYTRYDDVRVRKYSPTSPATYFGNEETGMKTGLVSTVVGMVPFYTNVSNPYTTSSLSKGQSQTIIFYVNATGSGVNTFFAFANLTSNLSVSNITPYWNVTIDTIAPKITVISPLNQSYGASSLDFNISGDESLSSCKFTLNNWQTNYTMNQQNATFFYYTNSSMIDSVYTVKFSCVDLAQNINNSMSVPFTVDVYGPNVNLTIPSNATYSNNTLKNLSFSAFDAVGLKNATLFIFNSSGNLINLTNLNISGNTIVAGIAYIFPYDGIFSWFYNLFDIGGHQSNTQNNTIIIDTRNPLIDSGAQTQNDFANVSQNWIYFNLTINETNFANLTFYLYNGSTRYFLFNQTTYNDSRREINWTNLAEGLYWYNATVMDLALNRNISQTRQIRLDTSAPDVKTVFPNNLTYGYNITLLNYTVSDPLLDKCWYNINDTSNISIACGQNISILLVNGVYTWKMYANDTLGHLGLTSVSFKVDTGVPAVIISYPQNITYPYNVTTMNFTATDATLDKCWYVLNGGQNVSTSCSSNITNIFSQEGLNEWWLYANDSDNNVGADFVFFTVDTISPNITILNPKNDSYYPESIFFNISGSEILDFCKFTLDNWTTNYTMNRYNSTDFNYVLNPIAAGNYVAQFWCNDSIGNINKPSNISFSAVYPNINLDLIYPRESINVPKSSSFNFTVNVTCGIVDCGVINVTLDPANWWNNSWNYRKLVNLSGVGNSLTDFQINLSVNLTNEYNLGKVKSDCSDIRFTNDSQIEMSYWAESCYVNGSNSTFWVKVPSIAAAGGTPIYMYYGNSNAVNKSNASATFDFYDSGNDVGTWTVAGTAGQTAAQGLPQPSYYAASANGNYMYKNISLTTNKIIEYNGRSDGLGNLFFLTDSAGNGQHMRLETRASNNAGIGAATAWTSWSVPSQTCANLAINTWFNFKLVIGSTTAQAYINDIACGGAYTFTNHGGYIGLVGDGLGGTYTTWWDNFKVRKYSTTMPPTSFGNEEVKAKGIVSTNTGDIPFFTNVNPKTTSNLKKGESQVISFVVNATGNPSTYEFFTFANLVKNSSVTNVSSTVNVTIISAYVYLIYPGNSDNFSNFTIPLFNFSISEGTYSNCKLYGNWGGWGVKQTMNNPPSGVNLNFSSESVGTDGYYIWNVVCTDLSAHSITSVTNYTFGAFLPVDPLNSSTFITYETRSDGKGNVFISWNSTNHTSKYKIYYTENASLPFVFLNETSSLNFTDANANQSRRRFYKISAWNPISESINGDVIAKTVYYLKRKPGVNTINWMGLYIQNNITTANRSLNQISNITSFTMLNSTTQKKLTCNNFSCPSFPSCTDTNCNFDLVEGTGYEVSLNSSSPIFTNWSLVGLVKEKINVSLYKNSTSFGKNWVSMYYNSSIKNAYGLITYVPYADAVTHWNETNQTTQGYTHMLPPLPPYIGTNFVIEPEKGYEISVNQSSSYNQS